MGRFAMAALLALWAALPAAAQQAGTYVVQGQAAGGEAYRGTATLETTGTDTWRIAWRIGDATGQGVGLMLPDRRTLTFGYVFEGQTGVIAYAVEAPGTLRGVWTMGSTGTVGVEVLTLTAR